MARLKVVLPTGEQYLYELDISEKDVGNVKLWFKGKNPIKVYDGMLLYRVDIVTENSK